MSEWMLVRLGDFVTISHGWPFKSQEMSEDLTGKPIVVNIGNFEYSGGFRFENTRTREYIGEYPSEYELHPGEILLVMTCQTSGGEILGIPGKIPDDGKVYLHNQRMGRVIIKRPDIVDSDFLYWLFLWRKFNYELYLSATGTKILHTAPQRIEAFEFFLPPLDEQRAIAHILGSLDDKIEANRRMNETLEATARAIFKSWFVDFDPVHAKANGEAPSGMDAATAALFPDSFEDSELGLVPRGWGVMRLDEIASFLNGLALQKYPAEDEQNCLPVIKIRELRQGNPDSSSNLASLDIPPAYIVDDGDVLFSWSGSLLVDIWTGGRGALNQHLFKVTSDRYPRWFYYFWTLFYLEEFIQIAADKATTMGHIKRHHLSDSLVVVPNDDIFSSLTKLIEPYIEVVVNNRIESRTLAETRDALLPRLVSGELRVGEVE